ncbi:MAG TPA: formate dehydrogenase subunit alpha [Gemmatimonadaceae bacterium]|nr:formate dehydrogenase subunit alpha [Gemmatimonadaceae bacterium]
MPTLTIDGRTITVPAGATILDAARALGIDVPTLCWYPKLPVVGNCRICLVHVDGAPKLVASCATAAADGMCVTTESDDAVSNRRGVLSMLLERYPADEIPATGARNEFEALVHRYDVPTTRRSGLPLRTGDERDGDPIIQHDMSTCILCTRCVRACEDIQVVGVLDVAYRGDHAQIIVGADGNPEHAGCTWCGECVRVCPTGAIHDILALPRDRTDNGNGHRDGNGQRRETESVTASAHTSAAPTIRPNGAPSSHEPNGQVAREVSTRLPVLDRTVRSVCPYCGVGCQIDLEVKDNRVIHVRSPWIEDDTPNLGSTCVKGRFGYDFVQHRDRLTTPLIRRGWKKQEGRWIYDPAEAATQADGTPWPRRGGPWLEVKDESRTPKRRPRTNPLRTAPTGPSPLGDPRDRAATPAEWYTPFREATWDEALELTAQELVRLRDTHGPDSLAVFQSAKCSNEENYLLQRMFRGGIGTNNVDHCTRLCHSSSVSAMQRAMNTSAASGSMREIEHETDVIFLLGANTTESHPVFGAALKRAVKRGATLIVCDPRRIELAVRAHIHLQPLPGTDVALMNAMLNHILTLGLEDREFIARRTHNFDAVRAAVAPYTPEQAETITGVSADLIRRAAEIYARGPRSSTLWAMGLTQHSTGTDIVTALLNLILATGSIGRWGAAMIPIRGQNNVQGASDVGAIPMVYTDYQPVTDPAIRHMYAETWGVPDERIPLTPGLKVTQIAKEGSPVRGMYIMGENPIISDPDVSHAEAWFRGLDFLTVQDLFLTETARYADVVLPGASFAEKDGTYVNTERRIQLARKAVDPPGQARGDLDIVIDLSNRIGLPTPFRNAADVMDEIARVTPSWRGVTHARLDGGPGLQYPVPHRDHPGTAFLFADAFPTTDGKATFHPVEYLPPAELPDEEYPFILNTGRQMYHWHTGTMTRRSFALDARESTPTVELNPDDAAVLGVHDGDIIGISSRRGRITIAVRLSRRVARHQVFVPMHYREAAANLLTNPALDPYAGIPEFKVCAVKLSPVHQALEDLANAAHGSSHT